MRTNSNPTCWYLNWQLKCSNSRGSSYNFCLVSTIFSFPFSGRKYRQERKCFSVWLMKVFGLKKNQVKDNASCKIEIRCNSFPFTIWKYRQKRKCFLVWLKKVYGLKKINSGIVLHAGLRFNAIAFPLTIWKYRLERNCI